MTTLALANGLVVNATDNAYAHILVEDGRIVDVVNAADAVPQADHVIDARDKVVIPGGVDVHCHIAQVTGQHTTIDDYASTSVAALWGGTTTIMDFGIPRDHSETPLDAAINKMVLAERSRCDVGLHASVINWDPSVPRQLEQLAALGMR